MKIGRVILAVAGLVFAPLAFAQAGALLPTGNYLVDSSKSKVVSRVAYLAMSNMRVTFPLVTGSLVYDSSNPAAIRLDVNVDATKLEGGSAWNNEKLKGEDFFNTGVYPTVAFKGTRLMFTSPKTAIVDGNMIVRGITKPSQLAVIFKSDPTSTGRTGRVSLAASTQIKRSDFGMTAWGGFVGEKVKLDITVEFIRR